MLYLKDKSNEKIILKLDEEEVSKFQIKMIKLNEINELIEFEICNENKEIDFYTSGLIPLESFLIKYGYKVDEDKLLKELKIALEKISDFSLDLSNLKIELDEIYLDEEAITLDNEIRFKFVYVPIRRQTSPITIDQILKRISEDIKIKTFTKAPLKETYENFSKVYDELEKEEKVAKTAPKWSKKQIFWPILGIYALILVVFRKNMDITLISTAVFAVLYALFALLNRFQSSREDLFTSDETMVMEAFPTLKKGIFEEKISINCPKFVIGKGDEVNLSIPSNLISKRHAMIEKTKLGYYIRDLNSKNHTYVNNTKLLEGEEKYLASGDKIKFASDNYVYTFENV